MRASDQLERRLEELEASATEDELAAERANELYIGRLVWNRLHYSKDPRTGKRISRQNAADTLIVHEVPDLRIVPQDLWDVAKQRQDTPSRRPQPANRKPAFWERQRPRYLVTGLANCGVCGSSYVKISANLFGCAPARDRGTCANRLNIRTETLENTILDLLKTRLMEPQLFKAFCEEFHRAVNRLRIDESSTLEAQRTALEKVKRRTGKLIELITQDDAPVQAMKAEPRALEAKEIELKKTLASAQAPAPLINPALAEVYRQHVAALQDALRECAVLNSEARSRLLGFRGNKNTLGACHGEIRISFHDSGWSRSTGDDLKCRRRLGCQSQRSNDIRHFSGLRHLGGLVPR